MNSYYPAKMTEPEVKKVPATQAVMRQARVAAMSARTQMRLRTPVVEGAMAEIPPMKMAREATWAKPQRA
jgi:hypothetical protein